MTGHTRAVITVRAAQLRGVQRPGSAPSPPARPHSAARLPPAPPRFALAAQIVLTGRPCDEGDWKITRVIQSNKSPVSSFSINEIKDLTTEKAQHFLRETMHIQMDNQCMFLPQERVGSFSSLAPGALLALTMRSAGSEYLLKYEEVCRREKRHEEEEKDAAAAETAYTAAEAEYKNVQSTGERVLEYKRLGARIKALELRIFFARMSDARRELEAKKGELALFQTKLDVLAAAQAEPRR